MPALIATAPTMESISATFDAGGTRNSAAASTANAGATSHRVVSGSTKGENTKCLCHGNRPEIDVWQS